MSDESGEARNPQALMRRHDVLPAGTWRPVGDDRRFQRAERSELVVYSLVTPSIWVTDAALRPGGGALLGFLEHVISMRSDAVSALAEVHALTGDARVSAWRTVYAAADADRSLSELTGAGENVGMDTLAVRLRSATFGDLTKLIAFLDHDAVSWAEVPETVRVAARGVLGDAAAALWCGEHLPDDVAMRLLSPWLLATVAHDGRHADAAVLGPAAAEVGELVARISALPAEQLTSLAAHRSEQSGTGSRWAALMHEATWAAHLSDRLRGIAVAQIRAVRVLDLAPIPSHLVRHALGLVQGAATATVVRDVVTAGVYDELAGPLAPRT